MKTLVLAAVIGSLGILPVYAFDVVIQPQLDSMKSMYGSMEQTADDIASGKDISDTETYRHAQNLSSGWEPAKNR